jgi:heavy metal-binding protein
VRHDRLVTRAIAAVCAAAAALTLMPGMAVAPLEGQATVSNAQAAASTAVYMCPMHPDVRGAEGDHCSRCGMALVPAIAADYQPYQLDFDITPHALRAGQRGRMHFSVKNPKTGSLVERFEAVHERLFHLFIVSQDLEYFAHVHPVLGPNGNLDAEVVLPNPGAYRLIADFVPAGAMPQFVQRAFVTAGYTGLLAAAAVLVPDVSDKVVDGSRVRLSMSPLVAGREQLITFDIADGASGEPVGDLEPYLGATGHLLAVGADLDTAFHSHPVAGVTSAAGPTIVFQVLFPRPANYRLWMQFQRHGRVATAVMTVPVAPHD